MPEAVPFVTADSLTSFLALSPDGVAVIDGQGTISHVNERLIELSGHAREALVGHSVQLLVPPRLTERYSVMRTTGLAGHPNESVNAGPDLWLLHADGHEVAVDIILRPVPTAEGPRILGVVRDVTPARETQLDLERVEAELRGMFQAHQDGIAVMRAIRDPQGNVIDLVIEYVNQAATKILGVTMEYLVGWRHSQGQGNGSGSAELLDYQQVLRTGDPITYFVDWIDPITGELTAILEVKGALSGPELVVACFRDVQEQRLDQERIKTMNVDLVTANESLNDAVDFQKDYTSAAWHELRTPLTAITGFATLLVEHWDEIPVERQRTSAEAILRNARRQLQLVEDLAHAAHLQSGRLVHSREVIDFDAVLTEAIASVAGAEVFTAPAPSGIKVIGDEGRAIQVLINLLSNALRYGQPPFEVTRCTVNSDMAHLCVQDGGTGVPPAFVPKLFEPFSQASRGNLREAKGTGLGLYISQSLAMAMDGSLDYEPGDPVGSRFIFGMPLEGKHVSD
ncbi:MAG: PAS domain S-box-containing protein [Glaciecola sp.]|jgi:PAS domain S-box-containing protein